MNSLTDIVATSLLFILIVMAIVNQLRLIDKVNTLDIKNNSLEKEVSHLKRQAYIKTLRLLLVDEVEEVSEYIDESLYTNLYRTYIWVNKIKTETDHGREVIYKGSIYTRLNNNGYETDYYIYEWKEKV